MALAAPSWDEQPTNRLPVVQNEPSSARAWLAGQLPASSLRSRLILAFASIIFLTLVLVGTGFLFVLRQYQEQREILRLGALMGPILAQARQLNEQQGRTIEDASDFLDRQADELDVRLVVARAGGIISLDTDDTLVNHRIDLLAGTRLAVQFDLQSLLECAMFVPERLRQLISEFAVVLLDQGGLFPPDGSVDGQ